MFLIDIVRGITWLLDIVSAMGIHAAILGLQLVRSHPICCTMI